MTDWNTQYKKRVRISEKNYSRLALTKDKTVSGKLDEILNLYFENKGGDLEKQKLNKRIKNL